MDSMATDDIIINDGREICKVCGKRSNMSPINGMCWLCYNTEKARQRTALMTGVDIDYFGCPASSAKNLTSEQGAIVKCPCDPVELEAVLTVTTDTKTVVDLGQAVKYDQGKPRMDLIPPEAIKGIAEVLTFGANKYAARNWEQGSEWGRFTAALLRHFTAWMGGEDYDPETGLNHLKHVLCNAAFLLTFQERGIGRDDRLSCCGKVRANESR